MTGFINPGSNPLSRMSIQALQDLGYTVNVGAADSYTLPTGRRLRGQEKQNRTRHHMFKDTLRDHKKKFKLTPIDVI